jgi:hypothetical protein
MVGLLIGKGGENLKKIERMSGVSKLQFSNGKEYRLRPFNQFRSANHICVM